MDAENCSFASQEIIIYLCMLKQKTVMLNGNNIHKITILYFDQINASLMSIRNFFKSTTFLLTLNFELCYSLLKLH